MKDIGDWLYFLIIIIAGISSFVSSIRKKQQQASKQQQRKPPVVPQQPTAQQQQPRPQQQQRRKQQPKQKPQPQNVQQTIAEKVKKAAARKPSIPTTSNITKDGMDIKPEDEGVSAITAEEAAFLAPVNTQEDKALFNIEDTPSNLDEWRKAFIYKEIFQRKY